MIASDLILRLNGDGWALTVEDSYCPKLFLVASNSSNKKLEWSANAFMLFAELPNDLLMAIADNIEEIKNALIPIQNK